jgi:electron transfer flavoprotein beta subunit
MKIIVCVKIVPDPEAPASLFKVDEEAKKVIPAKGTPPVLNPFDENALEAALKLKEGGKTTITVLSMGKSLAKPIVRKSLATGADELIVLEDAAFDDLDSYFTACIMAAALKKIGAYDLILCGREASDTNAGQVGSGIADLLGIPCVTLAGKIEASDGILKVKRVLSDGYETVEVPLPALVTVSNEIGTLRTANVQGMMAAQKKPLITWNAQELGLDTSRLNRTTLSRLFQPVHEGECEIITGATPQEAAANLASKLKENKVI